MLIKSAACWIKGMLKNTTFLFFDKIKLKFPYKIILTLKSKLIIIEILKQITLYVCMV